MFRTTGLVTKLVSGFAFPLAVLTGLVLLTFFTARTIERDAVLVRSQSAVLAALAQQMRLEVIQVQQWLTDVSATRAQDGLDDGWAEAEASARSFRLGLARFREMFTRAGDTQGLQRMAALEAAFEQYYESGRAMATAYVKDGPSEGNKFMAHFDETAQVLSGQIEPLVQGQLAELDFAMAATIRHLGRLRSGSLGLGVLALLISAAFAWLVTRSIMRPIRRVIGSLTQGAVQVTSASSQVATAGQEIAAAVTEQASSLQEISASLEQMSSVNRQNLDHARQADAVASQARNAAEQGREPDFDNIYAHEHRNARDDKDLPRGGERGVYLGD